MEGMLNEGFGRNNIADIDSVYSVDEVRGNQPTFYDDILIPETSPKIKLNLNGETYQWLFRNKYPNRPFKRTTRLPKSDEIVLVPADMLY